MKIIYTSILIIFIVSCTTQTSKQNIKQYSEKISKKDKIRKYENKPINIPYTQSDNFSIEDSEYRKILENELTEIPNFCKLHPDSLYHIKAFKTLKYGSEQGRDFFYQIYARYLSSHENKIIPRQTIVEIEEMYYLINIFVAETIGYSSEFYHTIQRIPAYVNFELLDYTSIDHQKAVNSNDKKVFMKQFKKHINKQNDFILSSIILELQNEIATEYQLNKAKAFTKAQFGQLLN